MNKQILYFFVLLLISYASAKCWTDSCCKDYCRTSICGSKGNYKGYRPTSGYMSGLTCVCTYSAKSRKC